MRLKDKVAIVTGAASGIGRATATLFAEEGASVLLTDVNAVGGEEAAQAIRDKGGKAVFHKANVSQQVECEGVVKACVAAFGRVNTLVNNAGVFILRGVEATPEDWQAVMATNVFGYSYLMNFAAEEMRKQGGGTVVNVGSVSSVIAQTKRVTYNASKGAVLQMTRCAALDLSEDNIRVNCVCPGVIWTAEVERMAQEGGLTREEAGIEFGSRQIMKRAADSREVAYPILFLASEESSFCTGIALFVDGGWTAM